MRTISYNTKTINLGKSGLYVNHHSDRNIYVHIKSLDNFVKKGLYSINEWNRFIISWNHKNS